MSEANHITDEQLLALVREALESMGGSTFRLDRLSMDATLSGLGVDSINAIELAAYIEDRLGIRLPDDRLAQVGSVRHLAELVRSQRGRAA